MTSTKSKESLLEERHTHATEFLDGLFIATPTPKDRPHVTLTFAQTVDGCIAGHKGKQLILSGEESMSMTHVLRTMHDGILVGVGTLVNDDPRLSARLVPTIPPVTAQPRPIILDTSLRTPTTCKLLTNFQCGTGRSPLIVTVTPQNDVQACALSKAGAEILTVRELSWRTILSALHKEAGIKRLMVEGGASVIESLLRESQSYVDSLIVTVSPRFAGSESATRYSSTPVQELNVKRMDWFGNDAVWWWIL